MKLLWMCVASCQIQSCKKKTNIYQLQDSMLSLNIRFSNIYFQKLFFAIFGFMIRNEINQYTDFLNLKFYTFKNKDLHMFVFRLIFPITILNTMSKIYTSRYILIFLSIGIYIVWKLAQKQSICASYIAQNVHICVVKDNDNHKIETQDRP